MATKDYIYLALLACSAIVFYLHGWYAGIQQRARRKEAAIEPMVAPEVSVFMTTVEAMTTETGRIPGTVRSRTQVSELPVHCFFGNN